MAIKNPQKKLHNVILIAGTKGKGSTATFIESALRSCGVKTGLYTSPHILSLRERIKVNGKNISDKDLTRIINRIKPQIIKHNITFFETLTAAAFIYFSESKIDYTILEVGLGGRLDATNVVSPKVSVITKIGYDHIDILGNTIAKIAREKAGIIHSKSYVIVAPQKPQALREIKKKIMATKVKFIDVKQEFQIKNINTNLIGSNFLIKDKRGDIQKFSTSLIGQHQIENINTAVAVMRFLEPKDKRITKVCIASGIARAKAEARCQVVSTSPLIIVDGAHNPESAKSLYNLIENIIKEKAIIIFGSSRGKLVKKMFRILIPVTKQFVITQSENPRHIMAGSLAAKLAKVNVLRVPFTVSENIADALKKGLRSSKNKIPLIVTGSFYVASEALIKLRKLGY